MSDPLTARVPTPPTPTSSAITARGVVAGYGSRPVLDGVDLDLPSGRVTSIIGPNGCGKSTLVRVLSRLLRPSAGTVEVGGRALEAYRPRDLARTLSLLPQNPTAPEGMTVADLAARGRQPHQPWWRQWSGDDEAVVQEAMVATGVDELAERELDQLSGGQRQRAWIAMTLAQQTDLLLLDEPTTHLDLAHAVEVLDLVVRLRAAGRTVVLVLHDLSLAARYSDHLVVLQQGRLVTSGPPADVVTSAMLAEVFGLDAHVFPDPFSGLPTVLPTGHA